MTEAVSIFLQIGAFAGFAAFSVLYFFRSDWRATSVGRNAMAFMLVGAVLLGLGLFRLAIGEEAFAVIRDPARIVSFLLINAVVWWRVRILVRLQREARDRDKRGT